MNRKTYFFVISAIIIGTLLLHGKTMASYKRIALAAIIGGAFGNILDRLLYGHVIDFFHLHWHQWSWPVFNVADMAISIGALLWISSLAKS